MTRTVADVETASSRPDVGGGDVDALLLRLLSQAYLFDDPSAYEAGVRDTFALLTDSAAEDHEAA